MSDAVADHVAHYAELTARNRGLISDADQQRLRTTRFVIAGCGSTGGACIMPLARSGAERFVLLDPGTYELNNLNRQDATLADLGVNKATASARRIHAVNPFADIEVHDEGVDPRTIGSVLRDGDLVIDAVDVTTKAGTTAKLGLHDAACARRTPVITAYDIAGTQFLELFDYRTVRKPLDGRVSDQANPDALLRSLIPPLALPREIFTELRLRRADPTRDFPQLAMTSALLSALIVPYALRLLAGSPVRRRLVLDLNQLVRPGPIRLLERVRRDIGLVRLWWAFRG
jgi:hypothetical protein